MHGFSATGLIIPMARIRYAQMHFYWIVLDAKWPESYYRNQGWTRDQYTATGQENYKGRGLVYFSAFRRSPARSRRSKTWTCTLCVLGGLRRLWGCSTSPKTGRTPMQSWFSLALLIVVCFAAAGIGGAVTATSVADWYATLAKPSWTPPGWIFGPVWSFLYLSMAVAAWLVLRQGKAKLPMLLFAGQLTLNMAWSWLFFGLHSPGAAFLDIVLLLAAIVATTVVFWRRSQAAGILFLPYLVWVAFATVLNLAIWRLNA